MNEEQQNNTYHTFDFLSKRRNDPKWRPQYLERLAEMQKLKSKRENKVIAFLIVVIIIELVILGYLMFFNPNANQESSMNYPSQTQSHIEIHQEETQKL
ncbi:hypothetical protein ACYSNW_10455 [Enterococcus sp. LJL99]